MKNKAITDKLKWIINSSEKIAKDGKKEYYYSAKAGALERGIELLIIELSD